jgi:hypothetical protein
MVQSRGDALFQLFADDVLQDVRLLMNFIPTKAKRFHQVELDQAMVANDLKRDLPAVLRQPDAIVLFVVHEIESRQALDHIGDRCRLHFSRFGDLRRTDALFLLSFRQQVNRLKIILNSLVVQVISLQ